MSRIYTVLFLEDDDRVSFYPSKEDPSKISSSENKALLHMVAELNEGYLVDVRMYTELFNAGLSERIALESSLVMD